jgi:hypothetical protein
MRFRKSILSAVAALALVGAAVTSYAQQKPAKASADHVAKGSVLSLTSDSMVLRLNKSKSMKLDLNADTQKVGDIADGKQVTVHYRDQKKKHIATSIEETAGLQAAPAPAKSKGR